MSKFEAEAYINTRMASDRFDYETDCQMTKIAMYIRYLYEDRERLLVTVHNMIASKEYNTPTETK